MKYFNRKTIEFFSVLLCIAMLIGLGLPAYLKVVQRASAVASTVNMEGAERAIDSIFTDPAYSNLANGPYQLINASLMNEVEPKYIWRDINDETTLPKYDELTVRDFKSIFISKNVGATELWIYGISKKQEILYAHYAEGVWVDSGVVPYEQGFPH